jgi:hypothetical protein
MFTLIGGQLLSSMCQHGVASKGLQRSSFFDYMFILWAKGVSGSSKSSSCHHLASGSCDDLGASSMFGVLLGF